MDRRRTMSPASGSGRALRAFSNKQTLSPLDAIFEGSNKSNRTMNSMVEIAISMATKRHGNSNLPPVFVGMIALPELTTPMICLVPGPWNSINGVYAP